MGNGVAETLQLLVEPCQFSRSQSYPSFQFRVEGMELLLHEFAVGYIAVTGTPAVRVSVRVGHRTAHMSYPALLPATGYDPEINRLNTIVTRKCLLKMIVVNLQVIRMNYFSQQLRIAIKLLPVITGDVFTERRYVAEAPIDIYPVFPVIAVLSNGTIAFFTLLESLLRFPSLCGFIFKFAVDLQQLVLFLAHCQL